MKAIVLFLALALASGALADEYTPVNWLGATAKGEIHVDLGGFVMTVGRCTGLGVTVFDVTYDVQSSKWQYRQGEDSEWVDIPGSERTGEICAFDLSYIDIKGGGQYRYVAEVSIDGEVGKYASFTVLRVRGEPKEDEEESQETDESAAEEAEDETAVEAVSWGFLKSRATR